MIKEISHLEFTEKETRKFLKTGIIVNVLHRVDQWLAYMEGHERWWDQIWAAMHRAGVEEVTCTPEHGPPNYQVIIVDLA